MIPDIFLLVIMMDDGNVSLAMNIPFFQFKSLENTAGVFLE
jgi:hypothetical protein